MQRGGVGSSSVKEGQCTFLQADPPASFSQGLLRGLDTLNQMKVAAITEGLIDCAATGAAAPVRPKRKWMKTYIWGSCGVIGLCRRE